MNFEKDFTKIEFKKSTLGPKNVQIINEKDEGVIAGTFLSM